MAFRERLTDARIRYSLWRVGSTAEKPVSNPTNDPSRRAYGVSETVCVYGPEVRVEADNIDPADTKDFRFNTEMDLSDSRPRCDLRIILESDGVKETYYAEKRRGIVYLDTTFTEDLPNVTVTPLSQQDALQVATIARVAATQSVRRVGGPRRF